MATLQAMVREYIQGCRPCLRAVLRFYQQEKSLATAVENAALARLPDGSKHPHQWRVPNATLRVVADLLVKRTRRLAKCTSFADLLTLVEVTTAAVSGFGELAAYDTALRIGARLGLSPVDVYVHAGTRAGCRALELKAGSRTHAPGSFPRPLQQLPPDEIEDFVCIYKDALVAGTRAGRQGPRDAPTVSRPRRAC